MNLYRYRKLVENPYHGDEYSECHHIIPRCLGGGDEAENLVKLRPRHHFLAHKILARMSVTELEELVGHRVDLGKVKSLKYAFACMSMNKTRRNLKSRHYAELAETSAKLMSEMMSGRSPWNKGTQGQQIPWNKGIKVGPHTKESNKQRSETLKDYWKDKPGNRRGKDPWNKGTQGQQTAWNKGAGSLSKYRWKCEHCGKEGTGMSNYTRWHGSKCKRATHAADHAVRHLH